MIGKIARLLAYRHAPRAATTLLHPKASARLAHTKYDMKHGYAPRLSAIAAAFIAVPVGIIIGKAMSRTPGGNGNGRNNVGSNSGSMLKGKRPDGSDITPPM